MTDTTTMYVIQGRIFAPDIVPYRLIITPFGTSYLKQALGFREASWNQDNGDYVFQDGVFEHNNTTVPITWLGFNDRRIVVQVLGDSDLAHAAYSSLGAVLAGLAPGFQDAEPIVMNEETSCAARLNFEWHNLLSDALVEYVEKLVEQLSTNEVRRVLKGVNIRFTLGAVTTGHRLIEHGIAPYDQTITVEPRTDVPLSERNYFTYSPCDSDTHLRLISGLEGSLSKKRKRRE